MPEENLLGRENEGFKLIMANFQWERLLMALGAVGAMQRRVREDRRVRQASARRSAGRSTGHQALRHKLADVATDGLHRRAASPTTRCAASSPARTPSSEVTMAKLVTQRACFEVMDTCLQIHGGAGYMREYEIERVARDARLGPIGGGTDEIMREILGKTLGL